MSEKDRKMWYLVNFPKFLETRIWGHRARGHKVTKAKNQLVFLFSPVKIWSTLFFELISGVALGGCTQLELTETLTYEITRAPNFQTVLQTSEEFCNKTFQSCSRVPIMGVCKGVLTSLTYDFATYKIDSLTSQWNVFVKKFDFPELNLDFFDFPG